MRWTRWKISELFKNLVEIIQRTMAKRKVWFGSVGPFLYDDERHKGIKTDGPIEGFPGDGAVRITDDGIDILVSTTDPPPNARAIRFGEMDGEEFKAILTMWFHKNTNTFTIQSGGHGDFDTLFIGANDSVWIPLLRLSQFENSAGTGASKFFRIKDHAGDLYTIEAKKVEP